MGKTTNKLLAIANTAISAERQELMNAGYGIIYGGQRQPEPANRRR